MLNLKGLVFGKLRVLSEGERVGHRRTWLCECICGVKKTVWQDHLRRGAVRSCGGHRSRGGDKREMKRRATRSWNICV